MCLKYRSSYIYIYIYKIYKEELKPATPKKKLCFINISVAPTSQRKKNKTTTKKHLQPKLVVPCGGPSRLRPWCGSGVSRAMPTEHSGEDRLTSHFPRSWCLWLRKIESIPVLPNPHPWLLRPAGKAASGHSGASVGLPGYF